MGFKLNLKWVFPVHYNYLPNSPSRVPCSFRGRGSSFKSVRLPVISEENVVLSKDLLRAHTSSPPQTLRSGCCKIEELKVNHGKRLHDSLDAMTGETKVPTGGHTSSSCISLQTGNSSYFCLLMKNIDVLEEIFDDSDVLRLEKDILLELGKLGALKLFYTFLYRTLKSSNVFCSSSLPTNIGQCTHKRNKPVDNHVGKIVFCSRKNKERKKRGEMASESSKKIYSQLQQSLTDSSPKGTSNSRNRRSINARNEAEMSKGVKVVAELERIRTGLEEQIGRMASLSCWAEAAGVSVDVLQQHLHFGWGLGIAYKDLIQVGNLGVLHGAERFDHTRGFKFSTYVQYWIRRSMARMVAQHARGIRHPYALSRAINKIQKLERP
ncbi:hypothetical protein SLE2022_036880 [Rubroshorea leprosula]